MLISHLEFEFIERWKAIAFASLLFRSSSARFLHDGSIYVCACSSSESESLVSYLIVRTHRDKIPKSTVKKEKNLHNRTAITDTAHPGQIRLHRSRNRPPVSVSAKALFRFSRFVHQYSSNFLSNRAHAISNSQLQNNFRHRRRRSSPRLITPHAL